MELKKLRDQRNELQQKFNKVKIILPALGDQTQHLLSNRIFFDNLAMNLSKDFSQEISVDKLLLSGKKFTTVKSIVRPENAKTSRGAVNEVYLNDDTVVKSGSLFWTAPDHDKRDIGFWQNVGMGNFNRYDEPGTERLVDSSFRQVGQNIVAKALGFDCIVHTELAIDNKTGNVAAMDVAKGKEAKFTLLCFDETELGDAINFVEKYNLSGCSVRPVTPELQRSSLEPGIVDFICAQPDRHAGNFFIASFCAC